MPNHSPLHKRESAQEIDLVQLNEYETNPYFLQIFQSNTTVCLIIYMFCKSCKVVNLKLFKKESKQKMTQESKQKQFHFTTMFATLTKHVNPHCRELEILKKIQICLAFIQLYLCLICAKMKNFLTLSHLLQWICKIAKKAPQTRFPVFQKLVKWRHRDGQGQSFAIDRVETFVYKFFLRFLEQSPNFQQNIGKKRSSIRNLRFEFCQVARFTLTKLPFDEFFKSTFFQLIYEFFLRFLESPNFQPRIGKKVHRSEIRVSNCF